MTPFEVLSHMHAKQMDPATAWKTAASCVHQAIGWSAVLAHALKAQPSLQPQLHAILTSVLPDNATESNIGEAFDAMVQWAKNANAQERACGLAIWAAQTQQEPFTIGELVATTPLAWRWDIAVSLMDTTTSTRPWHATLVHVLWMEHVANEHAFNYDKDHQVDPSMFSNASLP